MSGKWVGEAQVVELDLCRTHGARTQQCTEGEVHGVAVHPVRPSELYVAMHHARAVAVVQRPRQLDKVQARALLAHALAAL